MASKFQRTIQLIDEENSSDPNIEVFDEKEYPKELLYALRMTERLEKFDSNPSEAVRLAIRCQHICRWKISRNSYEMNRNGYFLWRRDLYKFHAEKTEDIACLVFLEFYFEKFSEKYTEEKLIDIVKKTWIKMSHKGHEAVLKLPFSDKSLSIIAKAIDV